MRTPTFKLAYEVSIIAGDAPEEAEKVASLVDLLHRYKQEKQEKLTTS